MPNKSGDSTVDVRLTLDFLSILGESSSESQLSYSFLVRMIAGGLAKANFSTS